MKHLKFLTLLFLICITIKSYSQISVTSYSIYALGISSNPNTKKISAELKTFANRNFEDLTMEPAVFFNFKEKEHHRFAIGLGLNLNPFRGDDHINSFVVPISLQIFPLQEFKQLSLVFELAPELLVEDGVAIRSLWGIRYAFDRKE
jgi:hypothetical protein